MLVAVYGSLRQGMGNHRWLLSDHECLEKFRTEPKYTMYSLGGFPAVVEKGECSVVCELYEVDAETERALDHLEGVAHGFYYRGTISTPRGQAVIYLMRECEGPVVASGDWVEFVEQARRARTVYN